MLKEPDRYPLTLAGVGGHAIVLKLDQYINMTVKILYPYPSMMKAYIEEISQTDLSRLMELIDEGIDLQLSYPDDLPLRQIAGHSIGSRLFPQHIDPPLCVWVKKDRENGRYVPVGYSVPLISGTPIKIGINPETKKLAEAIEQNFGLYVGNKGDSENAIIEPNGNIKFIDVEIRLRK